MENPADYALRNKTYIIKALEAIAWGYPVSGADDRYIIVQNPDFREEWGDDPNLVIDVHLLKELVVNLGG